MLNVDTSMQQQAGLHSCHQELQQRQHGQQEQHLHRLQTGRPDGGEGLPSDEVEGCSPTSDRSATLDLCSAHHYARAHTRSPKRAGLMRWIVCQLQRRQHSQHSQAQEQQQQQQQQQYQQSMVSGSSYDSLDELEQLTRDTRAGALTCPTQRLQHQHQQGTHQLADPAAEQAATPAAVPAAAATGAAASESSGGRLQRCMRAILRPVVRLVCSAARAIAASSGPHGPGSNDNSMAERVVNVLTSLPFFAVGLHGLRHRRSGRGRHFALSFLLVGGVASVYHGVHRACWIRPLARKLDYYGIAYASNAMRRAAHISLPPGLAVATALVAPLKPTLVTGLNLMLVEGKYLRAALAHTHLRPSFKTHITSGAVGVLCFAFEDVATGAGWPPVLHSLWHCLSAVAIACTHSLMGHLELALLVEGVQLEATARD